MFRYVVKAPGSPAVVKEEEDGIDTLALFQKEVGGFIEAFVLQELADLEERRVSFFANEEGKLEPTCAAHCLLRHNGEPYDVLFGNIVGAGYDADSGDTVSLTSEEANEIAKRLDQMVAVDSPERVFNAGNRVLDNLGIEPREKPPTPARSTPSI